MVSNQKTSEIIALLEAGLSASKVSEQTNVSITMVKNIRRNKLSNILPPIGGRPRALSDRNISWMMYQLASGKANTANDLKHSLNVIGVSVSASTIHRMLKMEGMSAITKKPKLYLSNRNRCA